MSLSVREEGDVSIVALSGSVDGLTAEPLTRELSAFVQEGRVRMVIDMSAVDYTSSAGLRMLLVTVKEARQRGGDLRLGAVRPDVLRVLSLSGFTSILKVFATPAEAVASFAAGKASGTFATGAAR